MNCKKRVYYYNGKYYFYHNNKLYLCNKKINNCNSIQHPCHNLNHCSSNLTFHGKPIYTNALPHNYPNKNPHPNISLETPYADAQLKPSETVYHPDAFHPYYSVNTACTTEDIIIYSPNIPWYTPITISNRGTCPIKITIDYIDWFQYKSLSKIIYSGELWDYYTWSTVKMYVNCLPELCKKCDNPECKDIENRCIFNYGFYLW